jgi:hypothetical protein
LIIVCLYVYFTQGVFGDGASGGAGGAQSTPTAGEWKPPKSPREVEEGDEDKGWVDEPPSLAAGLASTLV